MLENIINKETFEVNWNLVEQLPDFVLLKKGGYHADWHGEGNSYIHTQNVVNAAYTLPEWNELVNREKYILICACLFHDIGKGVCNTMKEDGNWSAPHHAKTGEKIARYLLWDEPFELREMICSLIKYHMKFTYLIEKEASEIDRTVVEISLNSNVKLLYLLNKCDSLGAISIDREDTLIKKELLKERAIALHCFDEPFEFHNDISKFHYFNSNENNSSPYLQLFDDTKFDIYIMSGIAGSGKSYYLKNNLSSLPIISRDIIRQELGFVDANGKFKGDKQQESKVTEIEEEKIKECCRNKQSFVYDNMSIKKMWRDKFINLVLPYNLKIHIVYVETSKENNIMRRKGQIAKDAIIKMQRDLEMPHLTDCHKIIYSLNDRKI